MVIFMIDVSSTFQGYHGNSAGALHLTRSKQTLNQLIHDIGPALF